MNLTVLHNDTLTMSTREIAELLGCNHSDIKRSADRLAKAGAINGGQPLAETPYVHNQNQQTYFEYRLCRLDSITLVAQNCPQFTAALVKRWDELESKKAAVPAIPSTYAEALLEAGRLALEVEKRDAALAAAAPKVAFVDLFVDTTGSKSLRETAKILRMPEKAMIEALIRDRILYRQAGNLLPYSRRQGEGLFAVKTGTAETQHAYTQTRVTPRGLSWLAGRYASELMVN
ncbi:MAG: phage antirepressor KilAC domain-containing protein [Plesiomonas shigelloides]